MSFFHLGGFRRCCRAPFQMVVYQLLTTLVECMKPELVVHLIGRLQECADGVAGNSKGGRSEVLAFVECLAANQGHVILTRSVSQSASQLNVLVSTMSCLSRPLVCGFSRKFPLEEGTGEE